MEVLKTHKFEDGTTLDLCKYFYGYEIQHAYHTTILDTDSFYERKADAVKAFNELKKIKGVKR